MPKKRLTVGIAVGLAIWAGVVSGTRAFQTAGEAIADRQRRPGRTVTGPQDLRPASGSSPRRRDLPTPFAKIVVTDDRGRYLVPDLPQGELQRLGPRIRAGGFAEDPDHSRQEPESQGGAGELSGGGGAVLSGRALAVVDGDAGEERVPRHRRQRQRHLAEHEEPGRLDPQREIGRLHRVPCARHQGHAGDPGGARSVSQHRRRVGSPREVGTGGRADERRAQSVRPRARAEDVRGLDRSDPCRRRSARAVSGRRASSATSSSRSGTGPIRRPTCTTSCRPTGGIRASMPTGRSTASLELSADYTPVLDPVDQHREPRAADGPRPEHAADQRGDAGAVAVLGRRGDLDQQEQRAQPDARSQGPGLAHVRGPAGGEPRRVQGGLEPSVGEALPGGQRGPPPRRCTIRRRRS